MTEKGLLMREEDFYDMLAFLVSSAYLMSEGEEFEEFYPSFRLMDAACRLTAIFSGGFEDGSWIRQFSDECENGLELMGKDNEAFSEFLMKSTLMLTKEIKRREEAE